MDESSRSSRVICLFCGVLGGWNVFVLVAIYSAILLTIVASKVAPNNPMTSANWVIFIPASVVGILSGWLAGRALARWLQSRRLAVSAATLILLAVITVLFFPRLFAYVGAGAGWVIRGGVAWLDRVLALVGGN